MLISKTKTRVLLYLCLPFFASTTLADTDEQAEDARVQSGLVVLYDFQSESGDIVFDRAGTKQPINLKIEDPAAVRRRPGSLQIRSKT